MRFSLTPAVMSCCSNPNIITLSLFLNYYWHRFFVQLIHRRNVRDTAIGCPSRDICTHILVDIENAERLTLTHSFKKFILSLPKCCLSCHRSYVDLERHTHSTTLSCTVKYVCRLSWLLEICFSLTHKFFDYLYGSQLFRFNTDND